MKIRLSQSKGYAFFLACLPIVMMYKFPVLNIGASTLLVGAGMMYALVSVFHLAIETNTKVQIPFLLYFLYAMFKSNNLNVFLCIAVLVHFCAIGIGAVDNGALRRYIESFSVLAGSLVILQFVVHLIFGIHIPLIQPSWCLAEMDVYRSSILSGINSVEKMYRPSAFFLEPSHLANYCSVGLVSALFMGEPNYKKAIIISLGVVCSTSGMGIAVVAIIWAAFPFFASHGLTKTKIRRICLMGFGVVLVLLILSHMPFFQNALDRILGSNAGQYNAIRGRTLYWKVYIAPLNGSELWLGKGFASLPEVYFTGIMVLLYAYGITGTVLFYLYLGMLFYKAKNWGCRLLIGEYGALLLVANLTSFITMIFYLGSVIALAGSTKQELADHGPTMQEHNGIDSLEA